jgi:hypothetical protein
MALYILFLFSLQLQKRDTPCARRLKDFLTASVMHLPLCLSLLVTAIPLGVAVSATPTILYPTDRPTFNYIDDVEISYETTFTGGAYLVLNCYEDTSHELFEWTDADNPRKCGRRFGSLNSFSAQLACGRQDLKALQYS